MHDPKLLQSGRATVCCVLSTQRSRSGDNRPADAAMHGSCMTQHGICALEWRAEIFVLSWEAGKVSISHSDS